MRRLLALTRDARLPLAATILAGFLGGLLTIWQARLFSQTVNAVFLDGRSLAEVSAFLRLLLAVIILRALSVSLTDLSAGAIARRIKASLRERLFTHILRLGPAYTRRERTGELTAAAVDGIEALDAYFSQYLPQLVISSLVPLSILVFVLPLDLLSALVLLLTAPLIPLFMILIGKTAEVHTKRQWESLSRLAAHFLDSLQGLTTLKLFGQSAAQARKIAEASEKYRDITLSVLRITFLSALALELLTTLSTAIVAVEVGLRLLYFRLSFEQALFLLVIAPEFYLPLRMLGLRFHAGMAGTSAARRIYEILDIPLPETKTKDCNVEEPKLPNVNIQLKNVSFTYPGEDRPALQDISITIPAGKHTALVGPSGAGKSTLVNLLLGFLQPTSGEILPRHALHLRAIAWVPQRPYLFHDTIAANIRLANPEADDQKVAAAAQAAGLDEFIRSLPEGYQTVIGEGGARLSSGQAQRLALARAFLKDAPILILDEPTSSLDPQTEAALEESIRRLMKGRTFITIAHRLNTVQQADQILVLDQGRLVESGTHAELLKRGGLYARLVGAHVSSPGQPQAITPSPPLLQEKYTQSLVSVSLGTAPSLQPFTFKPKRSRPVIRQLLTFLNGSWAQVALSVLLGALTVCASIGLLGASAWLISAAALHPSIADLQVAIVGVRFFGLSRGVFRYLERLTSHGVTFRLLARLRAWFYETLEPLAPARLLERRAGDLLSRIVADVEMLENFYVRAVAPPLTALLVSAIVCSFLGSIHPAPALTLLSLLLAQGLILPLLTRILSRSPGQMLVLSRAALHTQIVDGIQGLADLLAYDRAPDRILQLRLSEEKYARAQKNMTWVSALQSGLSVLLSNLGLWAVTAVSIPLVSSGLLDGVLLASLALIALAAFEAVQPLPLAAQTLSVSLEAGRRLFEIVETKPAVVDSPSIVARQTTIADSIKENQPGLRLRGLTFTYPNATSPALCDLSFDLPEGSSIAIVGPSGAGKSTLINLLMRFWDYQGGEIFLDGKPLRDYAQNEIRHQFAILQQNTYLFNASIRENLRLARPQAGHEEIEQAARLAQIHDFIVSLPHGYDTLIGEQGLRLSGGERQRLGLARALLRGSRFLVLDEPTAHLDALIERQVVESILRVMSERSVILITHRLVGLEHFEQILVLKNGHVVARGRHTELMQQEGLYRRMLELQSRVFQG